MIIKYLKENSILKVDNQSISSGGNTRESRFISLDPRGTSTKSIRTDLSEERFKEK